MPQVVIVGGGVSGLAAAYELEHHHVPYTLIEVKKRLGGSLITERRDGFVIDGGVFAFNAHTDFPPELRLDNALFPVESGGIAFIHGAQMLVDALAKPLKGTILRRMAVSSVGTMNGRFGVCLENGLVLDARALIIAAPARYAAHMLYDIQPELGDTLNGYLYDTIQRVSLGYRRDTLPMPILPPDMAFAFLHWTDSPHRAPAGHRLVQVGVRLKPGNTDPAQVIETVVAELGWAHPLVSAVHYWSEADPLSCCDPAHVERMAAIRQMLPPGVALVGSDYAAQGGVPTLSERVRQGQAAAQAIAHWLAA